jgi:nucleotide-binding universal stress UspA family protein
MHLAMLLKAATEEGVRCTTVIEVSDHPYEAIIRTAEKKGCDLILMASHGRRGVQGLLLGSETQKVLTHSRIPVLVYR